MAERYTTTDLAVFLRTNRADVIKCAKAAGVLHWNMARTRAKPFDRMGALAVIAVKRMGKLPSEA